MAAYLIDKVHTRYKFPAPYNNKDIKRNIVNTQALGKLGKSLSTWRTDVRNMIEEEGAGFDEIQKMWSIISEEDFKEFWDIEATAAKQKLRQWGKDMQKKNVAPHNLGSRGYAGKEPIWQKEDARREGPNPYDKIKDPLAQKFVMARSRDNPKLPGELFFYAKVKELENKILKEQEKEEQGQSEDSSDQKGPY